MIENAAIADMFDEIADLLALDDANPFRVRAYRNGARAVRAYGEAMSKLVASGADLTGIPAIGDDLSALIEEAARTGRMRALDALRGSPPAAASAFLKLEGVGPKKARALVEHLGVTTIEALHRAALDHRVRTVPGFGPKSEARLAAVLAERTGTPGGRWPIDRARPVARSIETWLTACPGVEAVHVAGSYRRSQETVGDLDVVAASGAPSAVVEAFCDWEAVARVVSSGEAKASVILSCGLQADLRVCAPDALGAMLHYFTGSKAHSIALRVLARRRGLKLNEYGVWDGQRRLAATTEDDVYRALGLEFIPPELRENRGEIELAASGDLPALIETADLAGDLHALADTPEAARALVAEAAARGFAYLGLGPHASAQGGVGRRDANQASVVFDAIDAEAARHQELAVFKLIEADIDAHGRLVLSEDAATRADMIVGSVQDAFTLSRAEQTKRLLKALDDPRIAILSHPTGRLVAQRAPYDLDLKAVAEKAAATGVALELSADPDRLDLTDRHCRTAAQAGALVAISAEARAPDDFDRLAFGVAQARRGWLEPAQALNTRDLTQISAFVASHAIDRDVKGAA